MKFILQISESLYSEPTNSLTHKTSISDIERPLKFNLQYSITMRELKPIGEGEIAGAWSYVLSFKGGLNHMNKISKDIM